MKGPLIIEPTVGRVVHYYPRHFDPGSQDLNGPQAATVAYVHDTRLVNLGVLDQNGKPYALQKVLLVQEGDPRPGDGYCCWLPYQHQMARKAADEAEDAAPKRYQSDGRGNLDRVPIKPAPSND